MSYIESNSSKFNPSVKLDLDAFTKNYVTGRSESLFWSDLKNNEDKIQKEIEGKRLLIIGGAGSIGSEFVKQTLKYKPASLVVFDISENDLAELTRDLRSSPDWCVPPDFRTYPISFLHPLFQKFLKAEPAFDFVANFAALKHVRTEKDVFSIPMLIENNVWGVIQLLQILKEKPPSRFFAVSSDKAVNPKSVMGASKRLMEKVLFAQNGEINVSTARFANVAFSRGSLLDGFLHRINKGQPLAAPLDINRYFISSVEAAQLCLISSFCGGNKEVFFPNIGREKLFNFSQIAGYLLDEIGFEARICSSEEKARNLAGKLPKNQYPVYFFESDTSGEKEEEEFFYKKEKANYNNFSSLGVVSYANSPIAEAPEIEATIKKIINQTTPSKRSMISLLENLLPEFSHLERGKNLDERM